MTRLLLLSSLLLCSGCSSQSPADPNALHVLFIGNSLTYTNDLPAMVAAFAESENRPFVYETIAYPDFTLQGLWNLGDARRALATGQWDFMVMQQGPSSFADHREILLEWSARFAVEARRNGTEPALFMVWPASFSNAFAAVIQVYTEAAEANNALLLPAGAAWLAAWEENPNVPLYGPDDFHPSENGTYLAALVIYAGLFDTTPIGLPFTLDLPDGRLNIVAANGRLYQEVAHDVLLTP